MHTETHTAILTKPAVRQLRENVIDGNVKNLLESVNTKSLAVRGWTITLQPFATGYKQPTTARQRYATGSADAQYVYEVTLSIRFEQAKQPDRNELHAILRTIYRRANQPSFGSWTLSTIDGEPFAPPTDQEIATSADMIGYAEVEIPDDFETYFSHLYGLDAHIGRVKKALLAGVNSSWRNRFHCVLQGPPGCGKSDICQSIKRALGEDAVLEFDATATTAAGAIKELTEREILPRILLVEEIEKADEKAMSFLLSVCDLRAQIRKTTARNTIQRDTRLMVIATVNDVALFDKLQAGALSSRFANKIWFKRPPRAMLARILSREIEKVDGSTAWIDPTLNYAEAHNINDPRVITALCLCGEDAWLDGSYVKMLDATAEPDVIDF